MIDYIRQVINKLFPKKNIKEAMNVDVAISDEMGEAIDLWGKMYRDESPWLDKNTKSLNLAAAIASELSRLTTLEMQSEITGSKRADYLNEQYRKVIEDIRRVTEYAAAKGGLIFKPYIDGESIAVDYVQADEFLPVKFDSSGNITAVIFTERLRKGSKIYTRLEYHDLLEKGYYISNTAYVNENNDDTLGKQVSLDTVQEWADLEPEILLQNIKKPLFAYYKIPIANTIDTRSPLGVSAYARAVNLIKEADRQYSRTIWEYEGSELAIDVDLSMLKDGEEIPEGKERIFRMLDAGEDGFYKVYSPPIRDENLFNGLNKILQRIEFNCGLAYGTLSDVQMVDKTAEEIRSSKQRTYSMVVDMQKGLQHALEDLIYAMDIWATIMGVAKGEYEVSFDFDDSLVVDSKTEQTIMLQEVSAGLIKPEKYLMERYGVTEEQARKMLPSMNEDVKKEDYDDME
jgi:A118 family predicted phage portal protein